MKLRVRANTLRLRLTRSEVDALARGETVWEATPFPDGSSFTYALVPTGSTVTASLRNDDGGSVVAVHVPAAAAREWAVSETVGLLGDGGLEVGPLHVLIEKDFDCLAPRPGDESMDTFPNPAAGRLEPGSR